MTLKAKIEALLFVAAKPMTAKKLAELAGTDVAGAVGACEELSCDLAGRGSGLALQQQGQEYQMVTGPEVSKLVADFLKAERSGDLTRPSLEALTIIAYRGPITKAELDLIRGVNCSLILRNLMIRGLIDAEEDKRAGVTRYAVSFDFLRHLGLRQPSELPDYERLNANEFLDRLLHPEADTLKAASDQKAEEAVKQQPS